MAFQWYPNAMAVQEKLLLRLSQGDPISCVYNTIQAAAAAAVVVANSHDHSYF